MPRESSMTRYIGFLQRMTAQGTSPARIEERLGALPLVGAAFSFFAIEV
jgi:hypothetical protein